MKVFAIASSFALTAVLGCELIVGNEDRTFDSRAIDGSTDALIDGGDTDAAPDPDGSACSTTCLVPASTCGDKCKTEQTTCLADCKKSPQACKSECQAKKDTCDNACIAVCTDCRNSLNCGGNGNCGNAVRK